MQIITAYNSFLATRGLSEDTCLAYGLEWAQDGTLRIPVKDQFGNTLFHKFRQNPITKMGPKYTYEKGAKASLFGAQFLKDADTVIICEGELDAACIAQHMESNIIGVSSTGGCGTWNEEWNTLLDGKKVFVCYDTDKPGILGSIKVHKKIPGSQVMFLPQNSHIQPKDITEMFQSIKHEGFYQVMHGMMSEAFEIGTEYPADSVSEKEKVELQEFWLTALRAANKGKKDNYWIKILLEDINEMHAYRTVKKSKYVKDTTRGDLESAKAYPIPDLIRLRFGKAKCIWHKDDTPSLTYYPDNNTVYCFGCQKAGDALDVYRQIHNCSLPEAINALKGT